MLDLPGLGSSFSSCGEQGLRFSCDAHTSHCGGFSYCRVWAPGLQSTVSVVVAHGLSCSLVCGGHSRPGIESVSPALAGRFFTTEPPGKPAGNDVAINCAVSHTQKQFVNSCLQSLRTLRTSLNHQKAWKPTSSSQCLQLMMGCPAGQKLDPLSQS